MSRVKARITALRDLYNNRDAVVTRRRELLTGAAGIAALVVVLVAVGVIYVVPFGKHSYSARLPEAQSVRVGDDVRLAGVPVGEVTGLTLTDHDVEMTFTVDTDVFVGAETTLDVRMLTIIGGHYVALVPAGTEPLKRPIPADRVRLPYNLARAFQDAVEPLRTIDGAQLGADLDALGKTVAVSPDGVREAVTGIGKFVAALDAQRVEVSKALSIADEQLGAVREARGELGRLVEKVALLETVLENKEHEVRTAVEQLDRVISRLGAVQPSWEGTLAPLARKLAEAVPELTALGDRLQPVIDAVYDLAQRLTAMIPDPNAVEIDQSAATVGPLCIPVPGRTC
ncbi:MlaD family protein [Nocardia thailandica]